MPKQRFPVKCVIFDMDGVITNTMPDHFKAWKTILANEGLFVSRLEVYKREGQQGFQSIKELFADHKKALAEERLSKILKKKQTFFNKIVRVRFIAGARSLLKHLQKQKVLTALVTGTSRSETERILPARLYQAFSVVVTGSDVKNGKPHPEPYCVCLSRLKLQPRDVVVIENAPFGIQSAKAAGLRCFVLGTSLPSKYLQRADKIFLSYRDMLVSVRQTQVPSVKSDKFF